MSSLIPDKDKERHCYQKICTYEFVEELASVNSFLTRDDRIGMKFIEDRFLANEVVGIDGRYTLVHPGTIVNDQGGNGEFMCMGRTNIIVYDSSSSMFITICAICESIDEQPYIGLCVTRRGLWNRSRCGTHFMVVHFAELSESSDDDQVNFTLSYAIRKIISIQWEKQVDENSEFIQTYHYPLANYPQLVEPLLIYGNGENAPATSLNVSVQTKLLPELVSIVLQYWSIDVYFDHLLNKERTKVPLTS